MISFVASPADNTNARPMASRPIILRLPPEWEASLHAEADRKSRTMQAVILAILARHYRIKVKPPQRGGYRRKNKKTEDNK